MTKGRKSFSRPPSVKANEEYGMKPRKKVSNATMNMGKGMGNTEFGFIQKTPKTATAAMMGRAPPKMPKGSKTSTRKDSRKQFKPKAGGKVF